jgi:hypothetical protein
VKKCPFCAEKIQDEAIVCRYCGRDLPVPSEPINNQTPQGQNQQRIVTKPKPSAWSTGAKVAAVFTVLAAIGSYIRYQNAPVELLGNLIFGSVVNFLVWWLLVTGIISIWGKAGETPWGRPVLVIIFLLLAGGCVVVFLSLAGGNIFNIFSPTPTPTPIPTSTPIPTITYSNEYLWRHCILASTINNQYYDQLFMQTTCVYGVITKKDYDADLKATIYDLFPNNDVITFLVIAKDASVVQKVNPNFYGNLTTVDVGDCIFVIGAPTSDSAGHLFNGVTEIDLSQLTIMLGIDDPKVREMTAVCK